jgi:hypothetical protein
MPRDAQLDFGSTGGAAPDFDFGAYSFGPFADAGKAPMPVSSGLQNFRVDAAAVIADQNPQLTIRVFEFDFDAAGLRVVEGIGQSLATDTVDFITNNRVQGTRLAFDNQTKIDGPLDKEFLWNARERLFEIV